MSLSVLAAPAASTVASAVVASVGTPIVGGSPLTASAWPAVTRVIVGRAAEDSTSKASTSKKTTQKESTSKHSANGGTKSTSKKSTKVATHTGSTTRTRAIANATSHAAHTKPKGGLSTGVMAAIVLAVVVAVLGVIVVGGYYLRKWQERKRQARWDKDLEGGGARALGTPYAAGGYAGFAGDAKRPSDWQTMPDSKTSVDQTNTGLAGNAAPHVPNLSNLPFPPRARQHESFSFPRASYDNEVSNEFTHDAIPAALYPETPAAAYRRRVLSTRSTRSRRDSRPDGDIPATPEAAPRGLQQRPRSVSRPAPPPVPPIPPVPGTSGPVPAPSLLSTSASVRHSEDAIYTPSEPVPPLPTHRAPVAPTPSPPDFSTDFTRPPSPHAGADFTSSFQHPHSDPYSDPHQFPFPRADPWVSAAAHDGSAPTSHTTPFTTFHAQ